MTKFLATCTTAVALTAFTPVFAQQTPQIDPARLSKIVQTISANDFEGRGPATPAERKTIDYVSKQFAAAGVEPGGENGSWFQAVPLARFEITGAVKTSLTFGGSAKPLTQGKEIVLEALLPTKQVNVANAPLVFVGYGVKAPECNWDDFKGVDLHGKIAVVLINDPDFEAPQLQKSPGCFGGEAMTYYGRWTYKYEEAARQGALGMLIVHETAPAAYGWSTVANSNGIAQFDIVRDDPTKAHPLVQGWIQRDEAVALFAGSGLDFEAQKHAAQSADFHPVTLKGASFSASYSVDYSQIVSTNVVARLKGTTHPDETIIYSAHWDHLGIGIPDATGDRIYHGAVDNGTGTAALIELARVFAAAPRPQRSIVFLSVTAEEKGLLGSAYYASHPLYPLATTVGDINMDALSTSGRAHNLSTSGSGKVQLEDELAAVLKKQGRSLTPDPEPSKGHYYRSDHFSFARVGVPAISIESGINLLDGGNEAGRAWNKEYVDHHYHQPGDKWTPEMKWDGIAEDVGVAYTLGQMLANSRTWPAWYKDAEFKSARDQTAAQRH